jgi:hypothetical protein
MPESLLHSLAPRPGILQADKDLAACQVPAATAVILLAAASSRYRRTLRHLPPPLALRISWIPDLESALPVAPVLQLGHDSFQILIAGEAKELYAVALYVARVKYVAHVKYAAGVKYVAGAMYVAGVKDVAGVEDDARLLGDDIAEQALALKRRTRSETQPIDPPDSRIRTDYLSVQLALSHLPVPLTVIFMAWPFAVPLETTENFSNSELGDSATIVLADLLFGSLHSTLASNLLDEVLVTVVLQDFAMPVGLKLMRSSFLIQV